MLDAMRESGLSRLEAPVSAAGGRFGKHSDLDMRWREEARVFRGGFFFLFLASGGDAQDGSVFALRRVLVVGWVLHPSDGSAVRTGANM